MDLAVSSLRGTRWLRYGLRIFLLCVKGNRVFEYDVNVVAFVVRVARTIAYCCFPLVLLGLSEMMVLKYGHGQGRLIARSPREITST